MLILRALAVAVVLLAPGCAHVASVATECAQAVTPALTARVDAVLAGGDYDAALRAIEQDALLCALNGAVREVIAALPRAAADPMAVTKRAHGQAWLAAHGAS